MQRSVSRKRYSLIAYLLLCQICFSVGTARGDGFPPLRLAGPNVAATPDAGRAPISQARELYSAGKELLKARQFASAATKLLLATERASVENLPFDEQSLMYYVLGLAYARAKRDDDAVAALKHALVLTPDDAECRLELAQIALRQRDFGAAQAAAEAALRIGFADPADTQEARAIVAEAEMRRLYGEGRDLLKAHKSDEAVAKLKEAAQRARAAGLPVDEQSLWQYLLGLALSHSHRDEEAIAAYREALRLSPGDAEARLELAQALLRKDRFDDARREGETALRLGLGDTDDKQSAAALIKQARIERLRERFSANVALSYGYDSNVLQGFSTETISGQAAIGGSSVRFAGAQPSFTLDAATAAGITKDYVTSIAKAYSQPTPSQAESDLPLTLNLDLSGRLFAARKTELWLGLRYYGYFMTSPQYPPDPTETCYADDAQTKQITCPSQHDIYNMQELTAPIRFNWFPRDWLRLGANMNGFINATGASKNTIAIYQGGFQGILDAVFVESQRWRSKLYYSHQLRRSFNRSDDLYLDGDRDEVKATQELRLYFSRVTMRNLFAYRFRSERTGVLSIDQALALNATVMETISGKTYNYDGTLGYYGYSAPLSYMGHELSARTKLNVPWSFDINIGLAYEPRLYADQYQANYQFMRVYAKEDPARSIPGRLVSDQSVTNQINDALASRAMQRKDQLVTADIALTKRLPLGFSLEIAYIFYFNKSNIANLLDNRNYTKHTLNFTAAYSF